MIPRRQPARPWLWPVSLAAVVVAAYSPVLFYRYGFTDDYLLLWGFHTHPGFMAQLHLMNGRPAAFAVEWVAFRFVDNVSELRWLRLVGILGVALLAVRVYAVCRFTGRRPATSWALGAAVVAVPAYQVIAGWAILFPDPFAASLALWAGCRTVGVYREPDSPARAGQLASVGVALTVSLVTYQPAAMCFWLAFALKLTARSRSQLSRPIVLTSAAVFVSSMLTAAAVWQLGAWWSGFSSARTHVTADPMAKITQFFTMALPRALWRASLDTVYPITVAAGCVILVGCWLGSRRTSRRPFVTAVGLLALLPLSYSPNLASAIGAATARTMLGLMPVTLILLVFALDAIARTLPCLRTVVLLRGHLAVVSALCLLSLATVSVTLYFARPQFRELDVATAAVARASARGPIHYVTQASRFNSFAPGVSYDEFGVLTSASPSDCRVLVLAIEHERSGRWPTGSAVRVIPFGESAPAASTVDLAGTMSLATVPSPH